MRSDRFLNFWKSMIVILIISGMAGAALGQPVEVRIVASNLTSGNFQSYEEPGKRILQGLGPDIVLMQEFNVSGSIDNFVEEVFGEGYSWSIEPGNDQIPNGIISRWPIVQSGQWPDSNVSNRDFAWARIDLPGERDLWAVSVHFLTSSASDRAAQARDLVDEIQANVPEGVYLVVGGDFNTNSRSESALGILSSVVQTAAPWPVDQSGNGNTNAGRDKPYDWVLVGPDLDSLETPVEIGSNSFSNGLVFDSRVYSPLLDVSPVQPGDSGVSGMQHMAVVRDFLIDGGQSDFTLSTDRADFGTVDAAEAPFQNSDVTLSVQQPFTLESVAFSGTYANEFSLVQPDMDSGAVQIDTDTTVIFSWSPSGQDGVGRNVEALFQTDGTPSEFSITLAGLPVEGGSGEPVDVSRRQVEEIKGDRNQTVVLPLGTEIPPKGFLVIGRDATQAQFESFWGALPHNATYLNGKVLFGLNGWPVINGDQQYRLLDEAGSQLDPLSGLLPASPISTSRTYQRTATGSTGMTELADPNNNATPGRFEGQSDQTGKVVITEFSDAEGSGNYIYEFVELYYDSRPVSPPEPGFWETY
jgi:endonuclease/exonuclease/phosphatase family metal-dependent hydrolase